MKRISLWSMICVTIACLAAVPALAGEGSSLELIYWSPGLSADGMITEDGIGTAIDFEDDLGMEDEAYPELRLNIATGDHSRLRLGAGAVKFSGDRYLERTIEFNGQTYTVGSRVVSDMELKSARFGWIWQWAHDDDGKVAFGTVLEARSFSVDASLKAPDYLPPVDESEKLDVIVPVLGFRLDVTPHPMITIFAEATGMSAGDYGKILDAEAGLRFKPAKVVSLTGGYRVLDIEAKDDPDYLNFKLSGPYLGLNFHF